MISTKDLSGLPNAERLKNFCKGLAALDIIMVEEEWSFIRHYTYDPAWRKGKEAFFATDGSDQSMIVMFAPEGCVINGVDSELYDWEEKLPRIEDLTDGMPSALQKLMSSRKRYFGVLLILLGVALGIVSRTAGGSPFQDFATGILMGLSAGILLVGILAILLSFIRRK